MIGRVTRSSTRGFVGAIKSPEPDLPIFGGFCRVGAQRGASEVIGVIYNISIEDDELTRQLAAADQPTEEELADHQFLRQIPIEFEALSIGYKQADTYSYTLPPQPPLSLAPIHAFGNREVIEFTRSLEFIPLILSPSMLPVDELLAAALRIATMARKRSDQENFLLEAGRYCADYLAQDLGRMDRLLRNIKIDRKGAT